MRHALAVITRNFGWLYLWVVLGLVLLAGVLAFSRYGDLKLGGEDDEPAVLRRAPGSPCCSPPAWASAWCSGAWPSRCRTTRRRRRAWCPARRRPPTWRCASPSSTGACIPGRSTASSGWRWPSSSSAAAAARWSAPPPRRCPGASCSRASPLFNVLAVVATAFGVAASLGMGATQINSGLHAVFGVPIGPAGAGGDHRGHHGAVPGLGAQRRGTRHQVAVRREHGAGRRCWRWRCCCSGRRSSIIDAFTSTLGAYLSELVRMSLRMTPFRESSWVGDWTIFYWAWWMSWSPFVGLFIARVSRGRTIRQFLLGTVLAPIAGGLRLVRGVRRHGPAPGDLRQRAAGRRRAGRRVDRDLRDVRRHALRPG